MIDTRHQQQAARRLWFDCVEQVFESLDLHNRPAAHDIAATLGVFCQEQNRLPDHTLSLLMARSFCTTGDTEAAERILRHDRRHSAYTGSWLDLLSSEYPFPELIPLFSSRILRPLRLTSATGPLWALDLQRVHLTEADRHELILLQTLRTLTEKSSNVWKKTGGRGTLGVKGLACWVRRNSGPDSYAEHIRAVLVRTAAKNGWQSIPDVLLLDL